MIRSARVAQIFYILAATVALSMCTQPYVTTLEPDPPTVLGIVIDPDSPSDLDSFFEESLPSGLSENITVVADISDADGYRWRVNGDDPTKTDISHVSVTGDMEEELTITREAETFTDDYSLGTTMAITLLVEVDETTYSADHDFVVE